MKNILNDFSAELDFVQIQIIPYLEAIATLFKRYADERNLSINSEINKYGETIARKTDHYIFDYRTTPSLSRLTEHAKEMSPQFLLFTHPDKENAIDPLVIFEIKIDKDDPQERELWQGVEIRFFIKHDSDDTRICFNWNHRSIYTLDTWHKASDEIREEMKSYLAIT